MALLGARVAAQRLGLSTRLLARLIRVFTFTRSMAILFAIMRTTFQKCAANLTATGVCKPARYIFHHPLTTQTLFLGQERTLGTRLLISVAVMRSLRMSTRLGTCTRERARRRLRATWLRWIQNRSAAVARNLLKDRFSTGIASALVAELRACMSSAFQQSTTDPGANVLCLDIFVRRAEMRLQFPAEGLSFNGLLFSGAASLITSVTTTVQSSLALAEALRRVDIALVTDTHGTVASTLASNGHTAHTRSAGASVTNLVAAMTTGQHLATWLQTIRDRVLAGGAGSEAGDVSQSGFTTWATGDTIWRLGAVSRAGVLRMARLLARVQTAVEGTIADIIATEASRPLLFGTVIAGYLAVHLFVLRAAKHFRLHLSTVATALNLNFTSTT